jgi:sulfite exporter TauE/SafE
MQAERGVRETTSNHGISYDENIIHTFAGRLYSRAASVMVSYAILGAILGAIGGTFLTAVSRDLAQLVGLPPVLAAGSVLGLLVGLAVGAEKAFALKLQAQILLCQAQIERNTRGR